jgi:hypothetical protein
MNTDPTAAQRRGRLTMLAVVAAFVLPIFLAWLLSSGILPWLPQGRLNYGSLIDPTVDLKTRRFLESDGESEASFERNFGEWTMATILPDPCDADCRRTVDAIARIHRALQQEMGRVQLAAIVNHDHRDLDIAGMEGDPGTRVYRTDVGELIATLRAARAVGDDQTGYSQIILVDHASRAMMIYPAQADMARVTKDVKRLLRASKTD